MYFLVDSLMQRMMVEIMKTVANAAREAMTIRQCFTRRRVEQGWTSVLDGLFETSQGAVVVTGVDLVVETGNFAGARGIRIPVGLVETLVVETLVGETLGVETLAVETLGVETLMVEIGDSVENEMVGDSAVELNPAVSGNCDVEFVVSVTETSLDVDKSAVLVVNVSLVVGSNTGAASEVRLAVIVVVAEAEGPLKVWLKTGAGNISGEVMGDNVDVTSGLAVDEGCCEDTATVATDAAAEAVAGAATAVEVVGDC